jgi:hypothetical protein
VEHDRYSKDDQKSGGYYSNDEFIGGEGNIFKIKFKPRQGCNLHQEVLAKQQSHHKAKLQQQLIDALNDSGRGAFGNAMECLASAAGGPHNANIIQSATKPGAPL